MISVYTDGSCLGNPGNGGWAFIAVGKKNISFRTGFEKNTTNNRMELLAAIKALEYLEQYENITINTDSNYVNQGITTWIFNWKKNNWKTSSKQSVKNKELWKRLDELNQKKILIGVGSKHIISMNSIIKLMFLLEKQQIL